METSTIALIGAGSWGTAVAIHLANQHHRVLLWGRDTAHVQAMSTARCNDRYLPNSLFPETLLPTDSFEEATETADQVILAVPSHAFKNILARLKKPTQGLTWLTKGLDPDSHAPLSQLVTATFGEAFPMAALSGPSFAKEVAQHLPTAVILASPSTPYLRTMRDLLHHDNLRVYVTHDLIGVQLCGAVKNILAIACGVSDGLHYGANAKAALITRGLAEMSRLGHALGAHPDTFVGLAGLGDLVLTCTDDQSRNRRFGLLLGQGFDRNKAEQQIGQVVEGTHNAAEICALATQHHIDMPICREVNALLQDQIDPKTAVMHLMSRPAREG